MAKEEIPESNSASGSGEHGMLQPQSTPYTGTPPYGGSEVQTPNNYIEGDPDVSQPRPILESQDAITLPFQPRVYQDGNHWYFEFVSSGVVFLPVATGNAGTVWHTHWNEAWPFRPKMADWSSTTEGAVVDINDVHNYDGGSDTRRPRLLLTDGGRNVIYLSVTLIPNEDSISRRADGTNGFGEGVIINTPELSLVRVDGEEFDTDDVNTEAEFEETLPDSDDSDFASHHHGIDLAKFAIKYNSAGNATIYGNGIEHPKSFVPLGERNYFVGAAPIVKVVKANDGEAPDATPFSVRHDDWDNTNTTRVFPWGSIYIDSSSTPSVPKIEWWRYDCPTYNFNNHTVDTGSNGDAAKHPAVHAATEDANVANLTAPNDDGLGATI